jgi:hypothetical protein
MTTQQHKPVLSDVISASPRLRQHFWHSANSNNTRVCDAGTYNLRDWQSCAKSRDCLNSALAESLPVCVAAADPSHSHVERMHRQTDRQFRIGDVKIPLPPISMYISVWAMILPRTPQRQRMAPTHNTRVCGSTRDFGGGGVNSVSSTHLSCNGMNLSRS